MKDEKICKFLFPDLTANGVVYHCHKNGLGNVIHNIDPAMCESCADFKNRYITYPLTVNNIKVNDLNYNEPPLFHKDDVGKFCAIRPCGEQYKNKTYLGIYLGDLPAIPRVTHDSNTLELEIKAVPNAAIFVPTLKKIIFGMESYWYIIENPEDMKEITDDIINGQWYVQALKVLSAKEESQNG